MYGTDQLIGSNQASISRARGARRTGTRARPGGEVQRYAGLDKENGIETPTAGEPFGAIGPSFGERQLPASTESKPLTEIEIGVSVELMVVVVGDGRDPRIEAGPVVHVVRPGVSQRKEHIAENRNLGRSLGEAG